MRNADAIREVADFILAAPHLYDQRRWAEHRECGTVCCIAGTAVRLCPGFERFAYNGNMIVEVIGLPGGIWTIARRCLGLSDVEAERLFSTYWVPAGDPSVPLAERVGKALYRLSYGESVEDVSSVEDVA